MPTGLTAAYNFQLGQGGSYHSVSWTSPVPEPGDTFEIWRKDDGNGASFYLDATGIAGSPYWDLVSSHTGTFDNQNVYYRMYTVGYGGYSVITVSVGPFNP
jgi:hypothetical protein